MKYKALLFFICFTGYLQAQWSNSGPVNFRHWNSIAIIDNQTAFLAGGNRANDSIRDIVRTIDGGLSWNTQFDQISFWYKSIAFPNSGIGIAVGDMGTIQKTTNQGLTVTDVTRPSSVATRHFNAICFPDHTTGYVVGGKQQPDSMQTILKSTDAGDNWSVQRDVSGHWLNAVFFVDANNGFAVGDRGAVLKTTNGGINWNALTLTGNVANRTYKGVYFLSSTTGFIVGGNLSNDSIQTILKTTDGGNNWNVIIDRLGPMLNAIDFAGSTHAHVVGNYGVAYSSADTGNTWTPAALPTGGNLDTMDLNAVKFLNNDFGIVAGKTGKIARYVNAVTTVPVLTTLAVSKIGSSSAQLNMLANANGNLTTLSFDYGLTLSMTNNVQIPGTINGNTTAADSIMLTGLTPNTFYYCRARGVSSNGLSIGNTIQFYVTDCEIINCDFEMWDTTFYEKPKGWNYNTPLSRVVSYNGSIAVQLGPGGGGVILANTSDETPSGGVPFPSRPDSLVLHARYDINTGDTAIVIAMFKKNGVFSYQNINGITGNSGGNWVRLSYAIQYADTTTPDSVMLAIIATNIFNDFPNPTNVMTIDDVHFTGTTDTLPNWQFEGWDSASVAWPTGWVGDAFKREEIVPYVERVADCVTGQFAAALTCNGQGHRHLATGDTLQWGRPAFPVAGRHQTINMYLKFIQQNHDTLSMAVIMFKNDSAVAYLNVTIDTPITDYTPFSFPFTYMDNTVIPDSASITFGVGSQPASGLSTAYIDNLSFDGFRHPTVGIKRPVIAAEGFNLYPNPANSSIIIELPNANDTELQLIDLTGKTVHQSRFNAPRKQLDVSALSPGIYLVKATANQNTVIKKLVIAGKD